MGGDLLEPRRLGMTGWEEPGRIDMLASPYKVFWSMVGRPRPASFILSESFHHLEHETLGVAASLPAAQAHLILFSFNG